MQDPLKQGLKLYPVFVSESLPAIPMQDPLKQGLKLVMGLPLAGPAPYSNARSTKTRIETEQHNTIDQYIQTIPMQDPLKQGLKQDASILTLTGSLIPMQDPLKQGLKPLCTDIYIIHIQLFQCKIH